MKYCRNCVFVYDIILIIVLFFIALLYIYDLFYVGLIKSSSVHGYVECMWFGALGGITISLKGVHNHSDPPISNKEVWNDGYFLWHLGRVFSGALAGLMTGILLSIAAGSPLVNVDDKGADLPRYAINYAAAFLFGMKEQRFFSFLHSIANVIVSDSNKSASQ